MSGMVFALLLGAAGPTVAPIAEPTPLPAPAPVGAETRPKTEETPFEVTGRVYARETFGPAGVREDARDPWTGRFSLESARVGGKYRADDLYVEIEAELEGEPRLRDAFVVLETGFHGTAIRAGQFKSPFAALALESSWKLPNVERGLLDELLIDHMQLGGRRPGAQLEWRGRGEIRPKLELGIWQGTDQTGSPREDRTSETLAETAAARASIRAGALELGASGAWRTAQPVAGGAFDRFWAGGADLTLDTDAGARAWIEGGAGSSWADEDPADATHATFGYARSVAAWRVGGASRGAPYVEPFASAGLLDPDVEIGSDLVRETGVGLNAGRWKRWRGQVEWLRSDASRNTPASLLGDEARKQEAVRFQIGVSI